MAADSKWYFTAEQLANSPSIRCGMNPDQELMYRQRAANLIQDMGQRLQVSQLCINTAIVYMHRFYAFHSFTKFHRNNIAAAALFLAAKVEEQPRKLEHIIKVVHICLGIEPPDPTRESYNEQVQDLVFNENVLLQTLGFDVAIDHPHTHVVKTCTLVKASKDLAQTSYFMASNSLHLTTMCLQYRPTVVACFCIHLACKWSRWEIPQSTEGRHWFNYVDKDVTMELLNQLTEEFLVVFDKCPTRLKNKVKSIQNQEETARISVSSKHPTPFTAIKDESAVPSNHHRSHGHHSKQTVAGEPVPRPLPVPPSATSSSSSTQINHKQHQSTSSISSRPRPSGSSSSSQLIANGQHASHSTSSSSSSVNQKPHHHSSSSSSSSNVRPSSSSMSTSSSSSQRPINPHDNIRESSSSSKSRMLPNPGVPQQQQQQQQPPTMNMSSIKVPNSANNQMPISGSNSMKQHSDSKNSIKMHSSSSSLGMNMYSGNSSSSVDPMRASASAISASSQNPMAAMKQQHSMYPQQLPPSYNQVSSSRSNQQVESKSVQQQLTKHASATGQQSTSQQQQYHTTPKKERRSELPSTPNTSSTNPGYVKSSEKKNQKRYTDSEPQPLFPSDSALMLNKPPAPNSNNNNNIQATKRPYTSTEQIKQDEGIDFRESKKTKLDLSPILDTKPFMSNNDLPNDLFDPDSFINSDFMFNSSLTSLTTDNKTNNKGFNTNVNGTETDPDVVSSILKESIGDNSLFGIGTSNSQISTSTSIVQSSSSSSVPEIVPVKTDSMELSFPTTLVPQPVTDITAPISTLSAPPQSSEKTDSSAVVKDDEYYRNKSEKKKKKEKHKHKDKDKEKSKESREEKKKHKKDKERHKDREQDHNREREHSDSSQSHPEAIKIKLQIPQEHSASSVPTTGIKIKIARDKISGSASLGGVAVSDDSSRNNSKEKEKAQQQTLKNTPLKVKISKDRIENFITTNTNDNYSASSVNPMSYSSSSSGKKEKKDRDRSDKDREKSKSSKSSSDYKQNGSNGNSGNNAANRASTNASKGNNHQTGFDYMSQIQMHQQPQSQQYYANYNANTQQQPPQQPPQQQLYNQQNYVSVDKSTGYQGQGQTASRFMANNGNPTYNYYNNSNGKK